MTSCRQLEVRSEDQTPQKWCVPLTEDVFGKLMSKGSPTVQTVFGDGSLFSPWLFGKFFDPSDAFPLWDFESDVLLSKLRSSSSTQSTVDWLQTDSDYVLKADLPGKCLDVSLIQWACSLSSISHTKANPNTCLFKKVLLEEMENYLDTADLLSQELGKVVFKCLLNMGRWW